MNVIKQKTLTIAIASAMILPMTAAADSYNSASSNTSLHLMPDESWISISGTVTDVKRDEFKLDYGDGAVTVEMDDGDRDADAYKLLTGDKVRVNGLIDNDFFENTSIEAGSVHVDKIDTTFYASVADDEAWIDSYVITTPVVVSEMRLRGMVAEVNADSNEFVIDSGLDKLTVDVSSMAYDPLDDEGYQKIEAGDVVSVSGDIDRGFFQGRELIADTIFTLRNS